MILIFFKYYLVKIHVDYFFTNPCDNYSLYNINKIEDYLKLKNPAFVKNNIFDYVKNSYGFYSLRLNSSNFNALGNNVVLSFKTQMFY